MVAPLLLFAAATVTELPQAIRVDWTDESSRAWTAEFSKDATKPLITSIKQNGQAVLSGARPYYTVETGKRRGGFDQFFDFPPSHPDGTRRFMAEFKAANPRALIRGERVEVRFDGLRLGPFAGSIAYTFYPGSRLVKQEAIVSTTEPDTAFYYDAGINWDASADRGPGNTMHSEIAYFNPDGRLTHQRLNFFASERQPVQARYRTVAMRAGAAGSLAVFPAPHQYFMPRDFTSNLGFVWARSFRGQAGMGIRQLPDENWVYYPWMNAPPGSEQRLSMFLQLSAAAAPAQPLEDVLRYTHRDRFPALPGYKTVAPHWHFAYTVQAMEHGNTWTPPFKPVLKEMGIDAAIIADFHGDGHPADTGELRLKELDAYFRATRAQSDRDFLLIPAEEANAHLGGHWIGIFPKPVYWFMKREAGQPFVEERAPYGRVYRTGSAADMFELIRRENGLVYTAHPRTKGSLGFPDKYRDQEFFRDQHFHGAGWKAMPADLSTLRQSLRALNLLDDMNNWGLRKKLIGEVDMFQLDSTHELYAHMNVNYVKLGGALPDWDSYDRLLEPIRRGDYFVSQGTVLLPEVNIARTGTVTARVQWTFPLAYAVIVADGKATTVPLDSTHAFGNQQFEWKADLSQAKWARIEVWDVAGNGAFINPVWF